MVAIGAAVFSGASAMDMKKIAATVGTFVVALWVYDRFIKGKF